MDERGRIAADVRGDGLDAGGDGASDVLGLLRRLCRERHRLGAGVIISVRGMPAPQGSKRHVGGGRMIEQSKAVGPWREAVRAETQRVAEGTGGVFDGPVSVSIRFILPRPKSVPKRITWPAKRPDLDKLARAVLDGLTDGGAWLDDGQVVRMMLVKLYQNDQDYPGCTIRIESTAP